jgi:hypothetical protein
MTQVARAMAATHNRNSFFEYDPTFIVFSSLSHCPVGPKIIGAKVALMRPRVISSISPPPRSHRVCSGGPSELPVIRDNRQLIVNPGKHTKYA